MAYGDSVITSKRGSRLTTTKLASKEAEYDPLCPHCQKQLKEVHWRKIGAVHAEYMFVCPCCRKVIGVGVRKAAWIN